jgi:hypothetical protein
VLALVPSYQTLNTVFAIVLTIFFQYCADFVLSPREFKHCFLTIVSKDLVDSALLPDDFKFVFLESFCLISEAIGPNDL